MSKERIKCARCHKHFRGSPKETLCPDCQKLVRQERAAAKASAPGASRPTTPTAAPRILGAGAGILDPRLGAMPSATSPDAPAALRPQARHDRPAEQRHDQPEDRHTDQRADGPGAAQSTPQAGAGKPASQPQGKSQPHGKDPQPPREPTPPTPPFELTDELRARIEARYLELAQPVEFDGIRTRIANELNVPKVAVKRAVSGVRKRLQLPSWWDLQAYTGSPEDLERIRAAYVPMLPVPDVGIHTRLAAALGLDSRMVYQGIRRIRAEMRLPQYNPPDAHAATTNTALTGDEATSMAEQPATAK